MPGAGSAKTESFNLGAATVMIGPKADVLDFTPENMVLVWLKTLRFRPVTSILI